MGKTLSGIAAYIEAGVKATVSNIWTASQIFNDNVKMFFGTGSDSSIYYDGTDMNVNPKEVGSGSFIVSGIISLGGFLKCQMDDLTISSGTITPTKSYIQVDTESAAATDDLTNIDGGVNGYIVVIKSADNARDTTLKDNSAGNDGFVIAGDFTLTTVHDKITLFRVSNSNKWNELCRSDNN